MVLIWCANMLNVLDHGHLRTIPIFSGGHDATLPLRTAVGDFLLEFDFYMPSQPTRETVFCVGSGGFLVYARADLSGNIQCRLPLATSGFSYALSIINAYELDTFNKVRIAREGDNFTLEVNDTKLAIPIVNIGAIDIDRVGKRSTSRYIEGAILNLNFIKGFDKNPLYLFDDPGTVLKDYRNCGGCDGAYIGFNNDIFDKPLMEDKVTRWDGYQNLWGVNPVIPSGPVTVTDGGAIFNAVGGAYADVKCNSTNFVNFYNFCSLNISSYTSGDILMGAIGSVQDTTFGVTGEGEYSKRRQALQYSTAQLKRNYDISDNVFTIVNIKWVLSLGK